MRTRIIPETLDEETADHVIDMVGKALLARSDKSEVVVTWDELENAANMKCVLEKHKDGVTLRREGH